MVQRQDADVDVFVQRVSLSNTSGKHLRAIVTPANLYLYIKKQVCWGIRQGTLLCITEDFSWIKS